MSYTSTTDTNTSVHSRAISAFFDTAGAAKKAVDDLVAAGIPRQHITETDGNTAGEPVTSTARAGEEKGFWESLKDVFLPEEEREVYVEGLRRGGYLVSVLTEEANYHKVLDILDNDGAVNLDEREEQWRSEGWTSGDVAPAALAAPSAGLAAGTASVGTTKITTATSAKTDTVARSAALGVPAAPGTATQAAGVVNTLGAGQDEVISLYEEQLRVGKRDVSHGRVRLRSYVVETPVNEQISLHNETVSIDRKPVNRPVSAGDAVFKDRIIEAEERREEAVVSKDVRVTEEITLRKTAEDRVQTVTDSVRSTKVNLEDTRAGLDARPVAAFAAQTDASRIVEHMDVISSDGQKIGEVDHLDGPDRIKLAKSSSPDGQHHYVPFTWIDHIDQHVHLKKTLADIKADQATLS